MPHACLPATAARRCHLTPPHALHGHVVEWRRRRWPSLMPLPLALLDEHLRPRQAALRVGDGPPPGLSLEHGPDDARACRRSQRRRIVQGRRSRSGVGLAPAEACSAYDQSARCTFWLECRSRQMAVFCAVSANNCSHGAPISLPTSTSTHPRLLRARGRCLGPSTRPYAPQTRLLEEKQ